jgi:protein TonB
MHVAVMLALAAMFHSSERGRETIVSVSTQRVPLIWVPDSRPAALGGGSPPQRSKQPVEASPQIRARPRTPVAIEPPTVTPEPEPLMAAAIAMSAVAPSLDGSASERPGASLGDTAGGGVGPDAGPGGGGVVYGVGNGVSSPIPVRRPPPAYTPAAMRARLQGTVVLDCVVQTDGTCTDIRVMQSLDPALGLDEQAIASARQWRFRPGVRLGEPVPVRVTLEIAFNIR